MKHLVIIRSSGSVCDYRTYNSQEVGLGKQLVKNGYQVTVILAGHSEERISVDAVEIRILKFFGPNPALSWFKDLDAVLVALKPDLVQIHDLGNFMTYQALRSAKKLHLKTVLIQGSYEMTRKPLQRCLETLYNRTFGSRILRSVDGIGCKTAAAAAYLNSIRHCSVRHTPVGLDASRFGEAAKSAWRSAQGWQDKHVLLYVGSLEPRRNPLFLVRVLSRLPSDYTLVMAGSGSLEAAVREEIRRRKLENRCMLTGKLSQSELPALYRESDLFMLASDYEIYGMVLLEACYFGVPALATPTAGALSIVENGTTGYVLPQLSVSGWAEVIEKHFSDPQRAGQMSAAAASRIREQLLWEVTVRHFMALYEQS